MSKTVDFPPPVQDRWPWGSESIVWGYAPEHAYTCKILEPARGRAGCLSLQYHHEKSESWLVIRGVAWALVVIDGVVCTRLMGPGAIQNLPQGVIHRVMGVTDDLRIIEPSTPDRHAADKSLPKDVVRLHCVLGREAASPRNEDEARIVEQAVQITEEAIAQVEQGRRPIEYHVDLLARAGGFALAE